VAPRLYLVCGLPGAGKTTRAREIAAATRAVRLCPDEWLEALGISLVDYDFRFRLEPHMLRHGEELLSAGVGIIVEFGSWSRSEREAIRQIGVRMGIAVELHFMDAPLQELVRRVLERGGEHARFLADKVLLEYSSRFERPTADEIAAYDQYVGG
jgi:predicted kinase